MLIQVQLLRGFSKPLTYKIPSHLPLIEAGTIVKVPVRTTTATAIVIGPVESSVHHSFTIKEIVSIEMFPQDSQYLPFIRALAHHHATDPVHFIARVRSFIGQKPSDTSILATATSTQIPQTITLTQEQQLVVDHIEQAITKEMYAPILLHGVTGSGKTEVYKRAIEYAYARGTTTLFLLPEVTLATQFERILLQQLPHIPMIAFHSASSPTTKKLLWQSLQEKKPLLIIGVHLPILLPIKNLGCIIIDEEHEVGFQEKKHPKVNTKSAAILRAQRYSIPIILGSATPSITSLYNVKHRGWKLFQLTTRFGGTFPKLEIVNLTDTKERKNFWITHELYTAIKQQLYKKEQTIIFLNRRGVCFFLQCKSCAHTFTCTSCSVSLTLHNDNTLKCHYCAYRMPAPTACPSCSKTDFLKKGIGTQQIVTILEKLFPTARIGRADLDTTTNKKVWQKTIHDFETHELDILVGTQTITKGFHFPKVTLVGIIWADVNLNFPAYNAQEVILQQLIQVAGRAGRATANGRVIMQVMTNSPLFSYVNEIEYLKFYEQEITKRALVNYPPLIRLAEIELKHKKETVVEQEAFLVAALLMKNKKIRVLGPSEPPISKIKKMFSRKMCLKADSFDELATAYHALSKELNLRSEIFFTPNPVS